jgi:hypothetical protein
MLCCNVDQKKLVEAEEYNHDKIQNGANSTLKLSYKEEKNKEINNLNA